MFWGVVMEECHCLFVRKEARENWPLAISCSSFCLNENRQAKTAQGTSDEKQCKESYSSGLQYGVRNNIQKCAIIVCFTCVEFMHCVCLFFVSFFTAGPVMVVRSDTAQRSLTTAVVPTLDHKVCGQTRARHKVRVSGTA